MLVQLPSVWSAAAGSAQPGASMALTLSDWLSPAFLGPCSPRVLRCYQNVMLSQPGQQRKQHFAPNWREIWLCFAFLELPRVCAQPYI